MEEGRRGGGEKVKISGSEELIKGREEDRREEIEEKDR